MILFLDVLIKPFYIQHICCIFFLIGGIMNMSKLKKIIFFLVVVLFTSDINAQAFYYINKNGTRLSKCEYDFIQKISNNDVLENINEVELSIIFEKVSCTSNILTNDIELFGTEHTTKSKSLNISKSCNGNNDAVLMGSAGSGKRYYAFGAYQNALKDGDSGHGNQYSGQVSNPVAMSSYQ